MAKNTAAPPLPHVKDDPAVRGARLAREAYTEAVNLIRSNTNQTPIDTARAINRAWRRTLDDLRTQWEDLNQRRQARLDHLNKQLPITPGIPDDTPAADRAVLTAAWKAALDTARAADAEQRTAMLTDAERYGDDTTRRAVLAAAVDDSQWDTVTTWAQTHSPDTGQHFTEWRELRDAIAGHGFDNTWIAQAFRPLDQPQEARDLPRLVETHNAEVRHHNATRHYSAPARELIELEPGEVPETQPVHGAAAVHTLSGGDSVSPAADTDWATARQDKVDQLTAGTDQLAS